MAGDPHVASQPATSHADEKNSVHLQNLLRLTDRILTGGEPGGDEGFAELKRLGITTVVSVDGAKPQLDAAKRYGLAYVHIPIGYEGINQYAELALARLVRDHKGPFYIHCHHGIHRAPAAAAVACIAAGDFDQEQAIKILRRAGTSRRYTGLWRDVANYRPPDPDVDLPTLSEVRDVGSMAAAMAQIDRAKDHLSLSQKNQWLTPAEHPDIVPINEVLQLRESLHEARRNLAKAFDDDFRSRLKAAEQVTQHMENALEEDRIADADRHFKTLMKSCQQCHTKYRD